MKINTSITAKLENIKPFIETKISFDDTLTEEQKKVLRKLAMDYIADCKTNLKRLNNA